MFKKGSMARFWIWTIHYHDHIKAGIAQYVLMAAAIILFLMVGEVIAFDTGIQALTIGGFMNYLIIAGILNTRRTALRHLEDPELREVAHQAMIIFLEKRKHKMSKRDLRRLYGERGAKYLKNTLWNKRNR